MRQALLQQVNRYSRLVLKLRTSLCQITPNFCVSLGVCHYYCTQIPGMLMRLAPWRVGCALELEAIKKEPRARHWLVWSSRNSMTCISSSIGISRAGRSQRKSKTNKISCLTLTFGSRKNSQLAKPKQWERLCKLITDHCSYLPKNNSSSSGNLHCHDNRYPSCPDVCYQQHVPMSEESRL